MAATPRKTTAKKPATKAKTTTSATKAKTTAKAAPKTTAAAPKAASVAKTAVTAPKATIMTAPTPVVTGPLIKKPELIDRVVAETGMKKKDVKPVIEGMLAVFANALKAGEELTLPPLGKVMIKRTKELPNATVINLRVRIPNQATSGPKDPLAEAAE